MSADSVRRRLEAATPGPWTDIDSIVSWYTNCYCEDDDTDQGIQVEEADANLIVHAPADLQLLLDAYEALEGMLAAFDPGDHCHGALYSCGKCAYDVAVLQAQVFEAAE